MVGGAVLVSRHQALRGVQACAPPPLQPEAEGHRAQRQRRACNSEHSERCCEVLLRDRRGCTRALSVQPAPTRRSGRLAARWARRLLEGRPRCRLRGVGASPVGAAGARLAAAHALNRREELRTDALRRPSRAVAANSRAYVAGRLCAAGRPGALLWAVPAGHHLGRHVHHVAGHAGAGLRHSSGEEQRERDGPKHLPGQGELCPEKEWQAVGCVTSSSMRLSQNGYG
eukprot:CAMPEP_0113819218 /NCGR_PEP_ID=MMETSP0328-20130328/630_1 /TAXON_ID=39455 /ORGANISM="Alexandrium minutum" /LENGTH=227 /DNA_ID=CAMNT_0000787153 /DNA_START=243 /DNA_END=922 /DNA_ORIENTATION=- /assembly_acc=CAM_ASM_000350